MKIKISVTLDADVIKHLENESGREGRSISSYLNVLAKNDMKKKREKQQKKE